MSKKEGILGIDVDAQGNPLDLEWFGNRSILAGLKGIPENINVNNVSSGLLAAIFFISTGFMIINAGNVAGLSARETSSWLFSTFTFSAILGIIMMLRYKMPIVGAWSIPGIAVAVTGYDIYTHSEVLMAFLFSGIIVLILGASGLIKKIMHFLPMPIVFAMIAGALMRFGTGIVSGFSGAPIIVGTTIIVYVLFMRWRNIIKVPPVMIAFLVALVMSFLFGQIDTANIKLVGFEPPILGQFSFNANAIISISIPLALLVIGAENAQAFGVLKSQGNPDVPITPLTVGSGIGGIVASLFGGHNANIAGPTTAICAAPESGPLKGRYVAGLLANSITGLCGLFASVIVPFILILPDSLIAVIAGLALVKVLLETLQHAFSAGRCQFGCFFTFMVAAANQSFLGISAVFWSLLVGLAVSIIMESDDFFALVREGKETQEKIDELLALKKAETPVST